MIKYLTAMIIFTVLAGGFVPFAQYIYFNCKLKNSSEKMLFSQTLLDYDMDDIKYENVHPEDASLVGRQSLANRGWVRCPNGTIMNNSIFESKKHDEYEIDLP